MDGVPFRFLKLYTSSNTNKNCRDLLTGTGKAEGFSDLRCVEWRWEHSCEDAPNYCKDAWNEKPSAYHSRIPISADFHGSTIASIYIEELKNSGEIQAKHIRPCLIKALATSCHSIASEPLKV